MAEGGAWSARASVCSSGLGINGSEPFPGSQWFGLSQANLLVILSQKKINLSISEVVLF